MHSSPLNSSSTPHLPIHSLRRSPSLPSHATLFRIGDFSIMSVTSMIGSSSHFRVTDCAAFALVAQVIFPLLVLLLPVLLLTLLPLFPRFAFPTSYLRYFPFPCSRVLMSSCCWQWFAFVFYARGFHPFVFASSSLFAFWPIVFVQIAIVSRTSHISQSV